MAAAEQRWHGTKAGSSIGAIRLGVGKSWGGHIVRQLIQTDQRDIPCYMESCSEIKSGKGTKGCEGEGG